MKTFFTSASILAMVLLSLSVNAAPSPANKRGLNQICYQGCVAEGFGDCERCCTFAGGSNTNSGCFGRSRRDAVDGGDLLNDA
ncbi:hypothetical protein OC861_003609 [Tilletia horrida]|nr:hypothetical protein OC861_003609 [Tilletia horrida]